MSLLFIDGADHLPWGPRGKWERLDQYLSWGVDDGGIVPGMFDDLSTPDYWKDGLGYADRAYELHNSYFGAVYYQIPVDWNTGLMGFHFKPTQVIYTPLVPTGWFLCGMKRSAAPGGWTVAWTLGSRQNPIDSNFGRLELCNTNDPPPITGPAGSASDYYMLEADQWHWLEFWKTLTGIEVYCNGALACYIDGAYATDRIAIMRQGMFWPAFEWDNLFLMDSSGLPSTRPFGECRVTTIWPYEDASVLWTPSAGSLHWTKIWEHAGYRYNDPDSSHPNPWYQAIGTWPDRHSTYVQASSDTDTEDEIFRFPNQRFLGTRILGVQVNATQAIFDAAHSDNSANDSELSAILRPGAGTLYELTKQSGKRPLASDANIWYTLRWLMEQKPTGQNWEEVDFIGGASWQFGLRRHPKIGAPYATPVRLTQFCVERLHLLAGGTGAGCRYRII